MTHKTINDAVRELNGKLPNGNLGTSRLYYHKDGHRDFYLLSDDSNLCINCQYVGTVEYFNRVASNRQPEEPSKQPPWHEAPRDATHAGWNPNISGWRWYKWKGIRYFYRDPEDRTWLTGGLSDPAWQPLHQRPQEHPTPTTEWPPIGTHCRVTWGTKAHVHECYVVTEDLLFTRLPKEEGVLRHWTRKRKENLPDLEFRPLEESERERWIKQAERKTGVRRNYSGKLYDALLNGSLPVPGGSDSAE